MPNARRRKDLVIIGTGGHGRELADVVRASIDDGAPWVLRGFVDANVERHGREIDGVEVLGDESVLPRLGRCAVVVGVGSTSARRRIVERLAPAGVEWPILAHPTATVTGSGQLSPGCVLMAGVVLTTNVHLGAHTHLNTQSSASHDCAFGAFVHLAPGAHAAGNVVLGDGVDVGIGASLVQGIRVGAWSVVGAGAVVIGDAPENVTLVGVPARVVKTRDPGWHLR
jgi:sugar O-acyltransferase (sialic acid O-acetyltransferase NeuD family)